MSETLPPLPGRPLPLSHLRSTAEQSPGLMDLRDEVSCVEHRQGWNPGMRTVQSYSQPRRALKLFIRQPLTQSGDESKKIVEGVLRIVDEIGRNGMTFEYLTGNTPLSDETFRESFKRSQGLRSARGTSATTG